MAYLATTPRKTATSVLIQNKEVCVGCKKKNHNVMQIITKKGEKGKANDLFKVFFKVDLAIVEHNYGAFFCRPCYNIIDRLLKQQQANAETEKRFAVSRQQFTFRVQQKRCAKSTENAMPSQIESSKKFCSTMVDSGLGEESTCLLKSSGESLAFFGQAALSTPQCTPKKRLATPTQRSTYSINGTPKPTKIPQPISPSPSHTKHAESLSQTSNSSKGTHKKLCFGMGSSLMSADESNLAEPLASTRGTDAFHQISSQHIANSVVHQCTSPQGIPGTPNKHFEVTRSSTLSKIPVMLTPSSAHKKPIHTPPSTPSSPKPISASQKRMSKKLCFDIGSSVTSNNESDLAEPLRSTAGPLASTPITSKKTPRALELSTIHYQDSTANLKNSIALSVNRESRVGAFTFYTVALKHKLSAAMRCLAQGSVQKALKLLFDMYPQDVNKLFIRMIRKERNTVRRLMNSVHIRKTDPQDLLMFTIGQARAEIQSSCPMFWAIVQEFAKSRTGLVDVGPVTIGALIILNATSQRINAFQYQVAIFCYHHCLQKEGIDFMSAAGASVGHTSLMEKLKQATEINDGIIKEWREALVKQSQYEIPPCGPMPELHPGFALVIDNLDIFIQARNLTINNQDRMLHYVQIIAVLDRVNVEGLPLVDPDPTDLRQVPNEKFLPDADDILTLREDIIHLPCGIYDKSENKPAELTVVMDHAQTKYVPGARENATIEETLQRDNTFAKMRPLPFVGDQLTCERIRGVHKAMHDGDAPEERLEGLIAMIMDFHEKMNYLEHILRKFYKEESVKEGGTLYQLAKVAKRADNISQKVSQCHHNVAEFIDLVTDCHVVAAAMKYLQLQSCNDRPAIFPGDLEQRPKEERAAYLKQLATQLVDMFVYHQLSSDVDRLQARVNTFDDGDQQDHKFNYATSFMTHGLIRRVTKMTTASGDGDRAVRNWKYGLLAYHTTGKIKYRLESFLILASVICLLPPRLREQLKWCRYMSLTGGEYCNIDCDEGLEIYNKAAKKKLKTLGSNHTPEFVMRVGQTIKYTDDVAQHIGAQVGVSAKSMDHKDADDTEDRMRVLAQLVQSDVFKYEPGRYHATFPNQPSSMFGNIHAAEFHNWLNNKKVEYATEKWAF